MVDDVAVFRRALGWLVAGVLLVCIDVRIDGFDLLPDALGWIIQAGAVGALRRAHPDGQYEARMTVAFVVSWVALALSFTEFLDLNLRGSVLGLAGWVQPMLVAYAFVRLATVVGSRALRHDWGATLLALFGSTALIIVALLLASAPIAAFAVLATSGAYILYLCALLHTRSAPDRVAADAAS